MHLKPGLYIVSTPIGNLSDITLRALEALDKSDVIFCEDSRVSNKLLEKHGIRASLKIYNDNSGEKTRLYIKQLVRGGKVVSLISDAGTPLISDPGYKLVSYLKEEGVHVDVLPGPCAAIAALTLSGLPTNSFIFIGFVPKTEGAKRSFFQQYKDLKPTVICYETAPRLVKTLEASLEIFGNRKANVAREITKKFQESQSNEISELIEYYSKNPPKGEIVLSFEGMIESDVNEDAIKKEAKDLLQTGLPAKTVTDQLHSKYKDSFKRSFLYKLVNKEKE